MDITCNVGGSDRTARIGLGAALIALGLFAPISKPLKLAASIAGVLGLATGITRHCPASSALGRNTCDLDEVARQKSIKEAKSRGTRIVEFVMQP